MRAHWLRPVPVQGRISKDEPALGLLNRDPLGGLRNAPVFLVRWDRGRFGGLCGNDFVVVGRVAMRDIGDGCLGLDDGGGVGQSDGRGDCDNEGESHFGGVDVSCSLDAEKMFVKWECC